MSRKQKTSPSENQIAVQESRIPDIAIKAFSNAFKAAIAQGASVLVARNGELLEVSEHARTPVRSLGEYGHLKSGTRLKIRRQEDRASS
ncbi:hypothetical protein [Pseudomonas sp. RIT-To-2]|uniref:hypothetical protein n=1 Tax=Pseudomonas sp. RIT-To-2 TaxID=3462541 RepID=UPI0024139EB1